MLLLVPFHVKCLWVFPLLPLVIAGALAQQSGTFGGALPPEVPGSTPSPANDGAGGHRTVYSRSPSTRERPIPVRGRVVLESGIVPSEPVKIEMICGSTIWPSGYSDSKGRFGVGSSPAPEANQDASIADPGNLGTSPSFTPVGERRSCDLRASMSGYSSGVVVLSNRSLTPGTDIGPVVLHPTTNVEGTTISATALAAPKQAQKALDKGREAARRRKWDDAAAQFEKAVSLYPKHASAWYELGRVRQRQENPAAAREAYLKAIEADPVYVPPYVPLAHLFLAGQNWQDAVKMADEAIRLDPVNFPESFYFSSVGYLYLRRFDAAETRARRGLQFDESHHLPKLYQVLGTALIHRRNYTGALEALSTYLELDPAATGIDLVRNQVAELRRLTASSPAGRRP